MSAERFDPPSPFAPRLPDDKVNESGNVGDDCPRCNQAEMQSFGGKLRCPACFYIQPCCNP